MLCKSLILMMFILTLILAVGYFFRAHMAFGESIQTEYVISVETNGTALCTVKQTGENLETSPDMLAEFQNNITLLLANARNLTGRATEATDFKYTAELGENYTTLEYQCNWLNFATSQAQELQIGDVFQNYENRSFFANLCGNGLFVLYYPSNYFVENVTPPPIEQNSTLSRLEWSNVNFNDGEPAITLEQKTAVLKTTGFFFQNALPIITVIVSISTASAAFYVFRIRGNNRKKSITVPAVFSHVMESDEERVLHIIDASESGLLQSQIVKQCQFSKSKTSQILTQLENKGAIRRYKRGRDKVVLRAKQTGTGERSE